MTKLTVVTPKVDKPASRLKVSVLMKRDNKLNIVGDMPYMATMAPVLGRFVMHCAREGDKYARLSMEPEDVAKAILNVIDRSTKDGCSDRSILTLRLDTQDWVVTIMPIYSVGNGNGN